MGDHYDVGVIGLGALGSAAAYNAAKTGVKVIAIEQFELGHVRGASHDTSRIVRTSYELPEYVALAKAAYRDWAELEKEAKQKLLTITGGVVILPKDAGAPAPDEWTNGIPTSKDWAKGLDANDIPYEILGHEQANKRWPALRLQHDREVIYTEDTGIAHAAKSVTAMQFLARMHGADMRDRTKVRLVTPTDKGFTLDTTGGRFSVSKVILACDGWTNELLRPLGVEIPLRVTQEQVTYFKPTNPSLYEMDKFLPWVWVGKEWYYGFPCFGEPTIKAGHDNAEQYTTANSRSFVPSRERIDELADAMQQFMPDPTRAELRTVTCLYTRTPDRKFVISPLKQYPDIFVLLGAAHGFKFAPAIGRIAAELAVEGETKEDISKFDMESMTVQLRAKI